MSGILDKDIAAQLKKWVEKSKYSQEELAKLLHISGAMLSRQLNGIDSIPVDRMQKIMDFIQPPQEEVHKFNAIHHSNHEKNSADFRNMAFKLNQSTVRQIGADGLLLTVLQYWCGFDRYQKVKMLEQVFKIADEGKQIEESSKK